MLRTSGAGNMQSAVDEKKKLELRVDNVTGELNKAKARVAELDSNKQQLQVRVVPRILPTLQQKLGNTTRNGMGSCGCAAACFAGFGGGASARVSGGVLALRAGTDTHPPMCLPAAPAGAC